MLPLIIVGALGLAIGGGLGYLIGHRGKDEKLANCINEMVERGMDEDKAVRICLTALEETSFSDFLKIGGAIAIGYVTYKTLERRRRENENK